MPERTLAVLARHFVTGLTSRYRARAEELSWRRAANRGRSNRAWEWIVGAVFVIAIILTGYRLVQTQQTIQSELENAKQAADQAKRRLRSSRNGPPVSTQSRESERSTHELQTKLDQPRLRSNQPNPA